MILPFFPNSFLPLHHSAAFRSPWHANAVLSRKVYPIWTVVYVSRCISLPPDSAASIGTTAGPDRIQPVRVGPFFAKVGSALAAANIKSLHPLLGKQALHFGIPALKVVKIIWSFILINSCYKFDRHRTTENPTFPIKGRTTTLSLMCF